MVSANQDGWFNILDVDQSGNNNEVSLSQTNFRNTATMEQFSNGKYAQVSQTSHWASVVDNTRTIMQETALPSNAYVTQNGTGNMTSIAQR